MQGLRRFQLGEREVDLDRGTVTQPGRAAISLTPNEVRLLQVLVAHAGAPVDRDRLLMDGLGYRRPVTTRAIDQAIWRLRRKLEDESHEPRYLHSDPSVGYRLELSHRPASPLLVGREAELSQLLAWVDAGTPEIWLVGAPGSGRSTLAVALSHARPAHAARCHITTRMPEQALGRVLRLGGLAPGAGRELLVRTAAATRGLAELPAEELEALHVLADRVDHHPRSLVTLGQRTLLERAHEITPAVDAVLVEFLLCSPPELVQAMISASVFPDAVTAADLEAQGIPREVLLKAWSASMCEGAGPGLFRIAAPLRQALAALGSPSEQAWAGFLARVGAQVRPLLEPAYTLGADDARLQLEASRPRLERALLRQPADEDLLLAWLVMTPSPEALAAFHPTSPAGRVTAAIRRAEQLQDADLEGARWEIDAALDLPVNDRLGLTLHRTRFQLALRQDLQPDELMEIVQRGEEVALRLDTPYSQIHRHQARGIVALRRGRWEEATSELLAGLSLCRSCGTRWLSANLLQNLSALAYRDGRIYEAVAWTREALESPLAMSASTEARYRTTLVTQLMGAGDLQEARHQIELVEMLTGEQAPLSLHATLDLLEGRPERAAIRLESSRGEESTGSAQRSWLFLSAWAALILGDLDKAQRLVDPIASDYPPAHVRDEEMLALVRAALAACGGEPERARAEMARIPADSSQRWSCACRWLEALLRACAGEPIDPKDLERQMIAQGVGDIALRLAVLLLERVVERAAFV
jgi:DNA-binding winged helix-turn-helix (wHTH) protein/tetratricopeptide (TPR) repeat protein